jgi:hypothetical protein
LAMGLAKDHPLVRFVQKIFIGLTALMPGVFGYQSFLVARTVR